MIDRCEPGRGSSGQSRLPLRKRCPALRIPSSSLAGWSLTRRPRLGVCLHTQRARQQAPRPGPSPQHPRRIRNLRQLGGLQQMERGQHLTRHTCGRCAAGWSGRRFAAAGRCGGETRDRQPASRYLAQHRSAGAAWAGSLGDCDDQQLPTALDLAIAGTVGALSNAIGTSGTVGSGVRLYMYNPFGESVSLRPQNAGVRHGTLYGPSHCS
jgi:hypothetical protein